jgi:hypothetical protein
MQSLVEDGCPRDSRPRPEGGRIKHDLVAVVRWIDDKAADGFVKRLLAAVEPR